MQQTQQQSSYLYSIRLDLLVGNLLGAMIYVWQEVLEVEVLL